MRFLVGSSLDSCVIDIYIAIEKASFLSFWKRSWSTLNALQRRKLLDLPDKVYHGLDGLLVQQFKIDGTLRKFVPVSLRCRISCLSHHPIHSRYLREGGCWIQWDKTLYCLHMANEVHRTFNQFYSRDQRDIRTEHNWKPNSGPIVRTTLIYFDWHLRSIAENGNQQSTCNDHDRLLLKMDNIHTTAKTTLMRILTLSLDLWANPL